MVTKKNLATGKKARSKWISKSYCSTLDIEERWSAFQHAVRIMARDLPAPPGAVEELYCPAEVACILQIPGESPRQVRRLIAKGFLKAFRHGRRLFCTWEQIRDFCLWLDTLETFCTRRATSVLLPEPSDPWPESLFCKRMDFDL